MSIRKQGTRNKHFAWPVFVGLLLAVGCWIHTPELAKASPSAMDFGAEYEPPPWSVDPTKGTAENPVKVGIIYVCFPNTLAAYKVISEKHHEVVSVLEDLFREQSFGAHNLQCELILDPGDTTGTYMWEAEYYSGMYGNTDSLLTLPPSYSDCWEDLCNINDSYCFHGELQGEILEKIQTAYADQSSPLAAYDEIAFVYMGSATWGTFDENPLGGPAGIAELHIRTDCAELAPIMDGAPSDSEGSLYGFASIWYNGNVLGGITTELAHERGHILGLEHPTASAALEPPLPVEEFCHFGGYSLMRASWPGLVKPLPLFPLFSHPERVQLGWFEPIVVDENMRNIECAVTVFP